MTMTQTKPVLTKPTVRIENVTPTVAQKYLGTQVRNRGLRENRTTWFVGLIERGEWELTNDCISFDAEGHLLNGQHRLTAITVTGATLPLAVMRGLPVGSQDAMDSGLTRSLGDALKMRGESNEFMKAAALQWLYRYDYIVASEGKAVHYATQAHRPTTSQLLRLFSDEGVGFLELESKATRANRSVKSTPGLTWALMLRQAQLDYEDMEAFWTQVIDGVDLQKNAPTLQLRNLLLKDAQAFGGRRMPPYRMAALIAKAWNLWRDGDSRGTLIWRFGGAHNDLFPVMR